MDYNRLRDLSQEYNRLQKEKKEITEQMRGLRRDMESMIPYKENVIVENLTIRKTSHLETKFDMANFKKEEPEMYAHYTRKESKDKFTVRETKE